jgi:hypothetical protein
VRSRTQILSLALCGLLISLKADGRFPLSESLPETVFQILLVPYTLALVAAMAVFLRPDTLKGGPHRLAGVDPLRLAAALAILFEALTLVVLLWEARRFAPFGYRVNRSAVLAAGLVAVVALAFAARSKRPSRLLFTAMAAYAGSQLLSIACFPLHPERSDMLPLIVAACRRMLSGENPYGTYTLNHQVPLTYLPALWLSYLPIVALDLDPRFVHAAATIASLALAYAAAEDKQRAAGLCALFLLLPYLQYRHEIYLGPHWLALAGTAFLMARGRPLLAAASFGVGMAMSQFSWVVFPLLIAHLWLARGPREASQALGVAIVVFGALVGPFLLWTPAPFLHGIFGHWAETVNLTTANLSFFVVRFGSLTVLRWAQALATLALLAVATRRLTTLSECFGAMAIVLVGFILLNSIVWVYFFLTVLLLLVLAAVTDRGFVDTGSADLVS